MTTINPTKLAIYVGELPEGHWDCRTFGDTVICANPDHEPRIIRNGKVEILKIDPLTAWASVMVEPPRLDMLLRS